jgi:hypothetical protein
MNILGVNRGKKSLIQAPDGAVGGAVAFVLKIPDFFP